MRLIQQALSIALAACLTGCIPSVAKDAVRADVAAEANVASPTASLDAKAEIHAPTSQPATGTQGDTNAGGDARPIQVVVTASGSAWPLVAFVAVVVAGGLMLLLLVLKLRSDRQRGNALAVARAIKDLPAGMHRDALLAMVKDNLPDRQAWDELLDAAGLRICQTIKNRSQV